MRTIRFKVVRDDVSDSNCHKQIFIFKLPSVRPIYERYMNESAQRLAVCSNCFIWPKEQC
jgi:hypothetical protein